MEYTQVLLKPLMTEKTTMLKEDGQTVAFLVHPAANKIEVKQAVEKVFSVKVLSVNVVRRASLDRRRQGRVIGRVPGFKKAYVTLAQGEKIEFFEGV